MFKCTLLFSKPVNSAILHIISQRQRVQLKKVIAYTVPAYLLINVLLLVTNWQTAFLNVPTMVVCNTLAAGSIFIWLCHKLLYIKQLELLQPHEEMQCTLNQHDKQVLLSLMTAAVEMANGNPISVPLNEKEQDFLQKNLRITYSES